MTNQYLWDRIAGRDLSLRAADADRERIADRLRKAHAEGRLDLGEFQERVERCYEAKTYGELNDLVRDLPRNYEQEKRRTIAWLWPWRWRLTTLAPMLIALFVIVAATGHHHVFWLWVPLLFLLWRTSGWRRRRWFSGAHRTPGDWI